MPLDVISYDSKSYEVQWIEDDTAFCHELDNQGEPRPSVVFKNRPAVVMVNIKGYG